MDTASDRLRNFSQSHSGFTAGASLLHLVLPGRRYREKRKGDWMRRQESLLLFVFSYSSFDCVRSELLDAGSSMHHGDLSHGLCPDVTLRLRSCRSWA